MNTLAHNPALHTPLQRFVFAVVAALRATAAAWHLHRRRRIALDELQALDDRMLRDIGVHRGELESLVVRQLDNPSADARRDAVLARALHGCP